jgi:hypothetical protein
MPVRTSFIGWPSLSSQFSEKRKSAFVVDDHGLNGQKCPQFTTIRFQAELSEAEFGLTIFRGVIRSFHVRAGGPTGRVTSYLSKF